MRSVLTALFLLSVMIVSGWALPAKELTVEDIYTSLPRSGKSSYDFKWVPGGEKISYVKYDQENGEQQLRIYNVKKKSEKVAVSASQLILPDDTTQVSLAHYEWLPSGDGLLIRYLGDLFYYQLHSGKFTRLTATPEREEDVALSPDGRWVSFVRENDLYLAELSSGNVRRLTSDGQAHVMNGKKDYVYQEEFGKRFDFKGYWWSPDSRYIAYYQMDDRNLPEYPLVDYRPLDPEVRFQRYPKPGDPLPVVKIGVVNIGNGTRKWLDLDENPDVYYPRVYWLKNSEKVAVIKLDRLQQNLDLYFADAVTGQSRVILSESNPYWINIDDDEFVYFFENKNQFIWGSERSGFQQLYLYDFNGQLIRQITSGNWAVTSLEGVNEKDELVYFISTRPDIHERQLYRMSLEGKNMEQLSEKHGIHSVKMSPDSRYYIDTFESPLRPERVTLHLANGKETAVLDENPHPELEQYGLVMPEIMQIKGENGLIYDVKMLKPADFDPGKKYPVLVYVYGGPHSQLVQKDYTDLWHQLMVQKGYIVFTLDNRGTANRGRSWETPVYKHLGKIELEDQLQGVRYLQSRPYVDADRIGIWGWSYGGYMTLYAMTHSDVFKAGAAVAPVTSWRYYDCIYTERYMGLPSENPEGYFSSAPLNFTANLSGKLLMAHGSGDDNVHFQNTARFIDNLVRDEIQFNLRVYPNQKHSITSTPDRIHLFRSITQFFLENL